MIRVHPVVRILVVFRKGVLHTIVDLNDGKFSSTTSA